MSGKCSRYPPKFKEGRNYKAWKNKTKVWLKAQKDLAKEDQAPLIRLYSFEDHATAERAIEQMTPEELEEEDGMDALFAKLDQIFLPDAIDEMFGSFRDVFDFKKPRQSTIQVHQLCKCEETSRLGQVLFYRQRLQDLQKGGTHGRKYNVRENREKSE